MSSSFLPLNAKQDVRPGTRNPGTFDSTLINSSVIPSLKYSSFLSALMFTNGSTATFLAGAAVTAVPATGLGRFNHFGPRNRNVSKPTVIIVNAIAAATNLLTNVPDRAGLAPLMFWGR